MKSIRFVDVSPEILLHVSKLKNMFSMCLLHIIFFYSKALRMWGAKLCPNYSFTYLFKRFFIKFRNVIFQYYFSRFYKWVTWEFSLSLRYQKSLKRSETFVFGNVGAKTNVKSIPNCLVRYFSQAFCFT